MLKTTLFDKLNYTKSFQKGEKCFMDTKLRIYEQVVHYISMRDSRHTAARPAKVGAKKRTLGASFFWQQTAPQCRRLKR
jgi:hypothetical protein